MTQQIAFSISGEALTDISRDMWLSDLPKNAVTTLTEGLIGITKEQALSVVLGENKLIGVNDIDFVNDIEKFQCRSLAEMCNYLEKSIITKQEKFFALYRKSTILQSYYNEIEDGETEYHFKIGNSIQKDIEKISEQLKFVYKLLGLNKKIPVFDLLSLTNKYRKDRGFGTFQEKSNSVVKVEKAVEKEEKLTSISITSSMHDSGYIDPQGRFYECPDYKHTFLAEDIVSQGIVSKVFGENASDDLDKLGWIKLSRGTIVNFLDNITQSQLDTIFDYMMYKNIKEIRYSNLDGDKWISISKLSEKIK